MKLYLCGLKSYQLDLGIECMAFTDPRLERTLQGIKRDHSETDRRQRTPLTHPYLLTILNTLGHTSYDDVVLRAAFTLAFAGFLRVGEFTYQQTDLDTGNAFCNWFLTKSSIQLIAGGAHLELNLPASKTDPFRHGIQLTIAASHAAGCPVMAMKSLIQIDSHRPADAPLFCIESHQQLQFTREYVVQMLQELVIRGGLGPGAWNGHSFRRGEATWAAKVGIRDRQIQTLGRWRSDTYKLYIEYSREQRIALLQRFQQAQTLTQVHNSPRRP